VTNLVSTAAAAVDVPGAADWSRVRISEVAEQVNDRVDDPSAAGVERYVGLEHLDPERLAIKRWGSPADVQSTKLRFQVGDVIFGKRRAYQRKLAQADFPGICSAHAMVLRARPEVVAPEFLPFLLQTESFFNRAVAISVGSLSPTINWRTLAREELWIPPLEVQRRLAALLWAGEEVSERWEGAASAADLAADAWASQRIEALAANGTVPLSTVSQVRTGVAKGRKLGDADSVELPYLRVANVQAGHLDLSEMKTIRVRREEVDRYRVRSGDVLLTEGGDFDKLGRGTVWRGEIPDCLHQNHIFAVRPEAAKLVPEFLELVASSAYGRAYFLRCAKQTTNLASINSSQLKALPVPTVEVATQEELAITFRDIRGLAADARRQALRAREIKRNLLRELVEHHVH
jgi:restriction endonuclease S subunit